MKIKIKLFELDLFANFEILGKIIKQLKSNLLRLLDLKMMIKEYYINLQKHKYERFVEITMNQTTYTREEASAKYCRCDVQ